MASLLKWFRTKDLCSCFTDSFGWNKLTFLCKNNQTNRTPSNTSKNILRCLQLAHWGSSQKCLQITTTSTDHWKAVELYPSLFFLHLEHTQKYGRASSSVYTDNYLKCMKKGEKWSLEDRALHQFYQHLLDIFEGFRFSSFLDYTMSIWYLCKLAPLEMCGQ